MTNQPREFTLRTYWDALRRHKWLILALAVLGALVGFGITRLEKKSYSATSSLSISDPNQQINVLGGSYVPNETPLQLASAAQPKVTSAPVTAAVKRRLNSPLSISALDGMVSTSVDPNSFLIHISASSGSPEDARISNDAARAHYSSQAATLRLQARRTSPTSPEYIADEATLQRLVQLSKLATPVTISNSATVPSSPSSPKTTTDTLAGLLIGLLLGIVLATARDALDRRLRHSRDVVKVLDHPVLGHIRSQALGHSGSASANGRGPAGGLREPDQESFRILRQNIAFLGASASSRTLLVTSAMAEEGKSTVAACLAVAMAQAGMRTLLVECDLRRPILAKRFGIRDAPGLSDYLTGKAAPYEILQPITGITAPNNGVGESAVGDSNLVCITSGSTVPGPAELLASERFHAFLVEVAGVYDSVILDTPPLLPVADTLAIVPDVSTLLLCVRLDRTTRDQARAAQSALSRLPHRPIGLVLTDVHQQEDGYYYGYYGSSGKQAALSTSA
jgi:succinoglycan biosynthesis transport protein ExoP